MVNDAVKAPIDVIEHVNNLHWCAVLAQSGEANYVTEIYCHLLVQLWLHHTSLFQAFHHWAAQRHIHRQMRQDHHILDVHVLVISAL